MKCPFCWKSVAGSPQRCPHCDYAIHARAEETPQISWLTRIPRLRIILIAGAIASVAVGVFARPAGLIDTTLTRDDARKEAGQGLVALMAGRFEEAREKLDLAVTIDQQFAEAHLSRAMAYLALGDMKEVQRGCTRAIRLLDVGGADPTLWEGDDPATAKHRAILMATRLTCVAVAAEPFSLTRVESGRLFECIYEIAQATDCNATAAAMARWKHEGKPYSIVMSARSQCPKLWPCAPQP